MSRKLIIALVLAAALAAAVLFFTYVPGAEQVFYPILLFVYLGFPVLLILLGVLVVIVILDKARGGMSRAVRGILRVTAWYGGIWLVCAASLVVWSSLSGSYSYRQSGGENPYTLSPSEMAGASRVAVGLRLSGAGQGREQQADLVTPPADEIIREHHRREGDDRYLFRVIAASPGVTWMLKPGRGVTLQGEAAIGPGTWRDYSVELKSDGNVVMKSGRSGSCSLDIDPERCAR